jgi:ATP-binding protein involved in chromosome partitioning
MKWNALLRAIPSPSRMSRGLPTKRSLPNVKYIVAVASGKGGVGKSTTAGKCTILIVVNLAVAASTLGFRSGILDADLFGPSIPKMMNLKGEPMVNDQNQMLPLVNYGVSCMSMGFLVPDDSAIVWRGLMVMKGLQQLMHQVQWPELDLLVIDMPPGTGDTQLTISQQLQLNGKNVFIHFRRRDCIDSSRCGLN